MFEAYAQTPDVETPNPADPAQVGPAVEAEPGVPTAGAPDTLAEAIQTDPALALDKVEAWVEGFQRHLPNIIAGLVLFVIFIAIGWVVQRSVRSWATRRDRANLGDVMGSFVKWVVIVIGLLASLVVIFPTFRPGDLIAGLGIGSVAIGFAFKDILQNWLAGLLLLIRRPFRIGDEIVVNGYEGKVEWIETRATMIRTYDGRRAIIPNAEVFTNAVLVNTAFEVVRTEAIVGIGYGDQIGAAREAILSALQGMEEVEADPAPDVLTWELGGSSVNLKVRWWSRSRRRDVLHVQSAVIEGIKGALDRTGIDMPFPTQVVLFHDQTEEIDGMRGKQREGWPSRKDGPQPRPLRLVASSEDASARSDRFEPPDPSAQSGRLKPHGRPEPPERSALPPEPVEPLDASVDIPVEGRGWREQLLGRRWRGRDVEPSGPSKEE